MKERETAAKGLTPKANPISSLGRSLRLEGLALLSIHARPRWFWEDGTGAGVAAERRLDGQL